jgi:DNA-binding transcriptional LysR family regulator
MDLRKLEIFQAVAAAGSFSQAAEQLHMAQPAVSIAIRKLEASLGVALFDRSLRQPRLTAEGRQVLARADSLLREADALRQSTDALQNLLTGELVLASPSMLATYFLPDLLLAFLRDHPGLTAAVSQAGTGRIEQMLLADEVELGVVNAHSAQAGDLEQVSLATEQVVVCVGAEHPWAGRTAVSPGELDGMAMVAYESGYYIRGILDRLCADAGSAPDFRMQSNFLPLLVRMVKQGLGVTVGLGMMADAEPGIVGITLTGAPPLELALAKRRGRTISRANQAFLDWAAFKLL